MVYEIFAFGRKPFFGMKNDEVIRFYRLLILVVLSYSAACYVEI